MRLNKVRTKFAKNKNEKRKKQQQQQPPQHSNWCYLNFIIGLYLCGDHAKINNTRDDSISVKHNQTEYIDAFASHRLKEKMFDPRCV